MATVRMVVSCLSIFGSLSIVISVLWRKRLRNPKIHPIFMISVADCLLGISWVIGGAFWFSRIGDRSLCYFPSLVTVVMQCVTVNLTVVYAVVAYSIIRKQDFSAVLSSVNSSVAAWQPWKIIVAYLFAWLAPTVLILVVFSTIASLYGLVHNANHCSCWCLPYFGNVIPFASEADWATSVYVYQIRKILLFYAVVLVVNYLLGFTLLVIMYSKILSLIRSARRSHEISPSSPVSYGAVGTMLMRGHSQAKKRVIYFLSVFIITGVANAVLSLLFFILEANRLQVASSVIPLPANGIPRDHLRSWFITLVYIVQSITAPLQGFLNALVYGWTREEFVRNGRRKRKRTSLVDDVSDDDVSSNILATDVDSGYSDRRDPNTRSPLSRPRSNSGGLLGERGTRGAIKKGLVGSRLTVSDQGASKQHSTETNGNVQNQKAGIM